MPISFSCPCGKRLRAKDEGAGRQVKCPACGTSLVIPAASEEPEPPTYTASTPEPEPEPRPAPRSRERPADVPVRRAPTTFSADRYKDVLAEKPARPMRDYAYFLLLLALVPLLFTLLRGEQDSIGERLGRTIEKASEADKSRILQFLTKDEGDLDDLLKILPDGKLEGAHLQRDTYVHYLYAALAAVGFFVLSIFLAPADDGKPLRALLVGVFTGTIGIVFLFLAQLFAEWTQGRILVSRNLFILVAYWIAFAIGFSYRAALDPTSNFVVSFLGYTFGVGLCEEVCKAIPLIVYYKETRRPDWRVACSWGFASGVGFGVAEAVMYSGSHYNGTASGDVYFTRFVSCVALHAIWSVSVALFIHANRAILDGPLEWHDYIPRVVYLVSVPMVLHGLYDTALKKEYNWLALLVALASFGWLAWCIERARVAEGTVRTRRA